MRNNFEKFLSGEVAVNLDSKKDLSKFFYTMLYMNFSSIQDFSVDEMKLLATKGFVVEYIPGQGFIFDNISNLNALTEDMYQNSVQIISLEELFGQNSKVAI